MDYMRRALALARQALGSTSPNPAVGAVIVKDGEVIGEGYTRPPGGPHAEVVALGRAEERARGATLYVTLEPCCHFGRTPPCTRAIIEAGVARVQVATLDPNPLVAGRGVLELRGAGIEVVLGEQEAEAQEINEAYVKYITTGLPFAIAKFAMSLDGKIATRTGDAKWVSGPLARRQAHRLRRIVDAIMAGANTVLADDPQLTYRRRDDKVHPGDRQPLRVVVDSRGRVPATSQVFQGPGKAMLVTARPLEAEKARQLSLRGVEVLEMPSEGGRVDLLQLLRILGERQVTSLLVDGGGILLGSFFDLGLVDKVEAAIAPIIIGGKDAVPTVVGIGVERVAQALRLERLKVRRAGQDIIVMGYIARQ
ncbi:MAG: bifunctional diaminohydroxyphosphoribosylaminopyrimidine deaminase/5-amino-6-(5-phosphoribosylamino)uracil reductase RibD [Chloroflexi bacterium]|nr:bifunctional diaminohydroxyphosphoribosylaminopyrimidine deaminase/5-amino-6-(5-phosphoribosylamino)uracil reductase RibD [Chloroflexota bacterium]